MPYKLIKLTPKKVKVINKKTGRVLSKSTTIEKAKKQLSLLRMIDNIKK